MVLESMSRAVQPPNGSKMLTGLHQPTYLVHILTESSMLLHGLSKRLIWKMEINIYANLCPNASAVEVVDQVKWQARCR